MALLIDLDGTLANTLPDFVAATTALAGGLGVPAPPAARVRALIGRGSECLVRDLLAHWHLGDERFAAAWADYQVHYRQHSGQHARAFPAADVALRVLRDRGMRLACVTNKPQDMAQALLEKLRLRDAFELVVGAAPGRRAKPHPDALLAACQQLALRPEQTWMLGDSRNDAQAAQAAGCAGVLLLAHGYNHGEPIEATPATAHLADWPALCDWLRTQWPLEVGA